MDLTKEVYSASSDEVLRFRTQPALEPQFEGQYHSWVEHIEGTQRTPMQHSWQVSEEQAWAYMNSQVASAVKLGWLENKPVKKAQQLGLF